MCLPHDLCCSCFELLAVLKDEGVRSEGAEAGASAQGSSAGQGQQGGGGPAAPELGADESLPAELVPLLEVLGPASDAHLYLTLEWLSRVGSKHGSTHPKTQVRVRAPACL